jgi:hypothetical protein
VVVPAPVDAAPVDPAPVVVVVAEPASVPALVVSRPPLVNAPWASLAWVPVKRDPQADATSAMAHRVAARPIRRRRGRRREDPAGRRISSTA